LADLGSHQRDWEDLGKLDPMWAVLSDPDKRFGGWDAEEFFATGEREINALMMSAKTLKLPHEHTRALDFGCGVGRLTRALAGRFKEAVGVDVSAPMVAKAKDLNADIAGASFIVNTAADLRIFPDAHFDLVYTNIVLQHLPSSAMMLGYIRDFVRVLKPGGLAVFQAPCKLSWKVRLAPRRRAYGLLRALGVKSEVLYAKLRLSPIRMSAVTQAEVEHAVKATGGRLLRADQDGSSGPGTDGRKYWVTKQEN